MKTLDNYAEDSQMLSVYRHDAHKMRGQSHSSAPEEWLGLPVNQDVPYGADGDAAAMSRPNGKPDQVLHGHETHYRRLLDSGDILYDEDNNSLQDYKPKLESLLSLENAEQIHREWLTSDIIGLFNESVYYPYTSLKYHTLLVGALVDCYRSGSEYDDLGLFVSKGVDRRAFRTVYVHDGSDPCSFTLDIDTHARGESAKLSSYPLRNFSSVWQRLPSHPWRDTSDKRLKVVDSQLRRIRSWSTALQYLEDSLSNGGNLYA